MGGNGGKWGGSGGQWGENRGKWWRKGGNWGAMGGERGRWGGEWGEMGGNGGEMGGNGGRIGGKWGRMGGEMGGNGGQRGQWGEHCFVAILQHAPIRIPTKAPTNPLFFRASPFPLTRLTPLGFPRERKHCFGPTGTEGPLYNPCRIGERKKWIHQPCRFWGKSEMVVPPLLSPPPRGGGGGSPAANHPAICRGAGSGGGGSRSTGGLTLCWMPSCVFSKATKASRGWSWEAAEAPGLAV